MESDGLAVESAIWSDPMRELGVIDDGETWIDWKEIDGGAERAISADLERESDDVAEGT